MALLWRLREYASSITDTMKRILLIFAAALMLCSCAAGRENESDEYPVVETSAFEASDPVLYSGSGYTIEICDTWKLSDIVQEGVDCTLQPAYPHGDEEAATLLAFQVIEGSVNGTTEQMGEMLAAQYNEMEGLTVKKSGSCTLGDIGAYSVIISTETDGTVLNMQHTVIAQDGNLYSIMLTASEGQFESAEAEAKKITDTFKITRKDEN